MSWKFAGIIINGVEVEQVLSSFGNLNDTKISIRIGEALKTKFQDYALGSVGNSVVIINHFSPYDSAYGKKTMSQLDQKLAALSKKGKVLCFILDGVTGTYGTSFFIDGEKVRSKKCISGNPPVTFGAKLPEEFSEKAGDEETLIFELISNLIDQPLQELIFDNKNSLTIYQE